MSVKLLSITEWCKAMLTESMAHWWKQLVTPFTSVSRGRSAQRVGGANATGSLLAVSYRWRYFSFPVSYNDGSTHEENTASKQQQLKYMNRYYMYKEKNLIILKKGNRRFTDVIQWTLFCFFMDSVCVFLQSVAMSYESVKYVTDIKWLLDSLLVESGRANKDLCSFWYCSFVQFS